MYRIFKKTLCVFLTAAITLTAGVAAFALTNGDIDRDGHVSAMDARSILRASVGLGTPFTESEQTVADIDMDGSVSAADARLALRASVDLEILPDAVCKNEYDALRSGVYTAVIENSGLTMKIVKTADRGFYVHLESAADNMAVSMLRAQDGTVYMIDEEHAIYAEFTDEIKEMLGEEEGALFNEVFDEVDLFSSFSDLSRGTKTGQAEVNGHTCDVYQINEIGGSVYVYLDGKKLIRISNNGANGLGEINFSSFSASVSTEKLSVPRDYEAYDIVEFMLIAYKDQLGL
ncbi:MAG: hypothetical protein IJK40_04825 [Clostridia bacterium]|nr:hypothetical protein [Clostridia bacterium]